MRKRESKLLSLACGADVSVLCCFPFNLLCDYKIFVANFSYELGSCLIRTIVNHYTSSPYPFEGSSEKS